MESNRVKRRKLDHLGAADVAASNATGVYNSSMFNLEVGGLVQDVQIDYGQALAGVDDILRKLKGVIEEIPPREPVPIGSTAKEFIRSGSVAVPYPYPPPKADSHYKDSYSKPAHIDVVGDYRLKTMTTVEERRVVDMTLTMPPAMTEEKDFANMRYFYKRAFFLATVHLGIVEAAELAQFKGRISLEYLDGNPLLPVLLLRCCEQIEASREKKGKPSEKSNGKKGQSHEKAAKEKPTDYFIRIIPCASADQFPMTKLLLGKCNLRQLWEGKEGEVAPPTPFYNSTLRAESCYSKYLLLHRDVAKACKGFKDACVLGKIWLRQRGLGSDTSRGGFGASEWTTLLAMMLQTGGRKGAPLLSSSLGAAQLFRSVVQYLASADFTAPVVLGAPEPDAEGIRRDGPVLWDVARGLNVLYKMETWSARVLQQHAKWTAALFREHGVDQFTPTFITKVDEPRQMYDLLFVVKPPAKAQGPLSADWLDGPATFRRKLMETLSTALGDRARLLNLYAAGLPAPAGKQAAAGTQYGSNYLVGVAFDGAKMARQVDHGPAAEERDAAARFRRFWGDRAELRRFKDGSIEESLIWSATTAEGVCEQIVRHVLKRHLGLATGDDVKVLGTELLQAMSPAAGPTDAAAFAIARQAFETFHQDLRALDGLPLAVRHVAAVAPALRSASLHAPPLAGSVGFDLGRRGKRGLQQPPRPMDAVLFLESSPAWPADVAAVQRVKAALLLRIARLLEDAKPGVVRAWVGLEEGVVLDDDTTAANSNMAFLDVLYADSAAAFRLRVHCDGEESLLRARLASAAANKYKHLPAAMQPDQSPADLARVRAATTHRLALLRHASVSLPLHTAAFAGLCARFPALSGAARLLKRWLAAHRVLAGHIGPELAELVAAAVFLHPHRPWPTPGSAHQGFVRALHLLARWDWRREPLVVDFSAGAAENDGDGTAQRRMAWLGRSATHDGGNHQQLHAPGQQQESLHALAARRLAALRRADPTMRRAVLSVTTSHDLPSRDMDEPAVAAAAQPIEFAGASPYTLDIDATAAADDDFGALPPQRPPRVVAARITALARGACAAIAAHAAAAASSGAADGPVDFEAIAALKDPKLLFRSAPETDFDVRIYLSGKSIRRAVEDACYRDENSVDSPEERGGKEKKRAASSNSRFANLDPRNFPSASLKRPLARDPVKAFVGRLAALYGDALVFFYGGEGGDLGWNGLGDDNNDTENDDGGDDGNVLVGAIWHPDATTPARLRAARLPTTPAMPAAVAENDAVERTDDEPDADHEQQGLLVQVDKQAVLAEIARLGGDFVQSIVVKGEKE